MPLPSVQKDAPIGAGESISHSDVTFAQVYGLRCGVGMPVFLNAASYEASERRNGPNSWKRPYVDGAPGPPLYQIVTGMSFQLGAIAQM